mmetsp:Transcript_3119/g.6449  ORF Transcript_3119/g.6449 Transcript_3119/m.6449 type:complete len:335 (-) Transcript_3119:176-1180(-)
MTFFLFRVRVLMAPQALTRRRCDVFSSVNTVRRFSRDESGGRRFANIRFCMDMRGDSPFDRGERVVSGRGVCASFFSLSDTTSLSPSSLPLVSLTLSTLSTSLATSLASLTSSTTSLDMRRLASASLLSLRSLSSLDTSLSLGEPTPATFSPFLVLPIPPPVRPLSFPEVKRLSSARLSLLRDSPPARDPSPGDRRSAIIAARPSSPPAAVRANDAPMAEAFRLDGDTTGDLGDAGGREFESPLGRPAGLPPPEADATRCFIMEGLMPFSRCVPLPLPMLTALRVLPGEEGDVVPIAADRRGLNALGLMLPPPATPRAGFLEEWLRVVVAAPSS